ncbi:jg25491, partial [Pararge aegeria aegeria]
LGGDLKGDWVQTGGALLVGKGGRVIRHFTQTGPSDHLPNKDILELFDLENEYKAETMANKKREELECNVSIIKIIIRVDSILKVS